jgi:molecular chaperone GrpE
MTEEIKKRTALNEDEKQENASKKDTEKNIEQKKKKSSSAKKTNTTKKLKKENEELKIKVLEKEDKFLRLYSEFDNYRRRTSKERIDLLKNASKETISEILPVIDDFERALENISTDEESAKEGIELIFNKLKGILSNKGLKNMDSMGQDFDPDIHEAVTQIPAPSEDLKGKVVDVIEKGYSLNDKVIRFAKVVVGK